MTSLTKMLAVAGIASVAWTDAHGNPIVIDNCRFTFITPNLVRMEYANKGKFLDDKTLFAQNRDILFDGVQVEKKDNNRYVFTTPAMRLEYQNDGFPFGQSNIKASFKMDGKDCGWGMASSQRRNLKGAIATLDGIGGPVPLEEAQLSAAISLSRIASTARPWRLFIMAWIRKQVMTTHRNTLVKLEYLGMFFRPLEP